MTTLHTDINVLNNMLAVNLNISLWSARKKLTFEDVNHIPNNDLPPQDLATLGSKRIAPPESLRVFTTLKARAVNTLDRYGVRFMSGWAIPEDMVDVVMQELTSIRDTFNTEKEAFLNEYDSLVAEWISKHPEWETMLKGAVDTPDYVRSRMSFAWQLYRVQSSSQVANSGLEEAVHSLGNTLFDDIVKTADETWRKVYEGKSRVTHKALSPLRTLEQKLVGLSFVEPHVFPVAQMINRSLSKLPKRGNIEGNELLAIQGLVCLMRDKDALVAHAKKLLGGQDMDAVLDALLTQGEPDELAMAAYTDIYDPTGNGTETFIGEIHTRPIIADSMGLW